MLTPFRWMLYGALALGSMTATLASSGSSTPEAPAANKIVPAISAKTAKAKPAISPSAPRELPKEAPKIGIGDALIAQNTLRIYLDRPASISVFNARGQLVFRQDSQRKMEALPLQGVPTGFLYLTLRAGQNELTKKLLYTGK